MDLSSAEAWVRSWVPIAGPLELWQTEPWASVYRARAVDEVLWFKACSPLNAFEVSLTAALSSRWDVVTEVVASDGERRWLLMADAGTPLRAIGNPLHRWLEILPRYAELQIGETVRGGEHVVAGVPDLRPARLPGLLRDLRRALPLDPSVRSSLARFQIYFGDLCSELEEAGADPSVQHDDLHMSNVYARGSELRVLDWGDASISHPFFSLFETFRSLRRSNGLPPDDPWFDRLRDAYLEPWGAGYRQTFDLALRIGGVARAIAWVDQREELTTSERVNFDRRLEELIRFALRAAGPP